MQNSAGGRMGSTNHQTRKGGTVRHMMSNTIMI